jgi:hypothetical protein
MEKDFIYSTLMAPILVFRQTDVSGNDKMNEPNKIESHMKNKGIKYEFTAKHWQHAGPAAWHFVSLPNELARELRNVLKSEEEGWGRLKATAKIGNSEWKTALWFDTKAHTYLLPLKAEIRKVENLEIGKNVEAVVWI